MMCIFHKWGKWSDPILYPTYLYKAYQRRVCSVCNKTQERQV